MKIFTLLSFFCFFITSLFAQPTLLTYPNQAAQQAQGGSNGPWVTPGNILATDGNEALSSTLLTVNAITDRLIATRFNFAIPATATILGIEVQINRAISDLDPSSNIVDHQISLFKNAVLQPTNKANLLLPWPVGAPVVEVYGGPTDLWGTTWTPAQINASNFAVGIVARRFQLTGGDRFARVEDVRVRIYWFDPSLPIVLKSFDVRKVNVSSSQISWVTEQEINVSKYEVERSANGTNFSTIAQVTPKSPNSNSEVSYSVTDNKPLPGTNFYRLKQTDIDGKFEIFYIKSVTFDNKEAFFKVNTANNRLKLTSANKKGLYSLLIRDTAGRLLQQEKLNLESSVSETYINLKPSVKGVVFVTINGSSEQKSFRLFVE